MAHNEVKCSDSYVLPRYRPRAKLFDLLFSWLDFVLVSVSYHCSTPNDIMTRISFNAFLSKLIANLKTVSSRLIRKEYPEFGQKYFYGKPYFWTGAYFVASCGGVTVE